MDNFMHEKTLKLYRLQLNRTTNQDVRRNLLRCIAEEKRQYLQAQGGPRPILRLASRRLWRGRSAKTVEQDRPDA